MHVPEGDTFLLFVYGTLKRGGCRHAPLARQAAYRGEARTLPRYALYDLGAYPGLQACPDGGGQAVHGELYEVDAALRPLLDRIEGAPDWFDLAPVELDGVEGPAWAYFYQGDARGRPRIGSGLWHNNEREGQP
jgi:gamma-glutamylcyclotransferase (GGCT)/AIG2-like uncharacterized protein YtfP